MSATRCRSQRRTDHPPAAGRRPARPATTRNKPEPRGDAPATIERTRRYARRLLLLADLHIGSTYGLWPEKWQLESGGVLAASAPQRELLAFWRATMATIAREWDPDTVVILADVLEGINRKELGVSLMACDLEAQKEAALSLIAPVCAGRLTLLVDGSLYHESVDTKVHKDIAARLHDRGVDARYLGPMATLRLAGTGRTINVAHGVGAAAIYRGTVMDREAMFAELGAGSGKIPKVDLIARGHLHYYGAIATETTQVVQCPCWKAYQPMRLTIGCWGRKQPAIGAVVVAVRDDDAIEIHPYLMPKPPKFDDRLRRA